jgi:hypothetical protein
VGLALNFSQIQFDDAEITVVCLLYGDDGEKVLQQIQDERNGTHVFRRQRADSILAVSVVVEDRLQMGLFRTNSWVCGLAGNEKENRDLPGGQAGPR